MSPKHIKRVLYHHRTQGKAVEGVHIRSIADAMKAEGVVVDILSLPGADPYTTPSLSPTRQANGLMKLIAGLPGQLFELAELAYNAVIFFRVSRYLRAHPDVTFIYERYSLFTFATVMLARWRKLPIILEVNDSAIVDRVRPLFLKRLALAIERWVFRKADGLVFVSNVFRQRALDAHGHMAPAIVSPNAANIAQFSFTAQQRAQTRQQFGLDDSVVCGYLGAFIPWHAIDQFVYRIADRLDSAPHLKLLLVGDGATFDQVKAFVAARGLSHRIVLSGRVPHAQVPMLLAAMDMAILPSAGDYTSPVKLFEFMACGIAPVAPDFEPIREILTENQNGRMFKAGDLDAAVEIVLQWSRSEADLRRIGGNARSYIETQRQWRHNILQLFELYSKIEQSRV